MKTRLEVGNLAVKKRRMGESRREGKPKKMESLEILRREGDFRLARFESCLSLEKSFFYCCLVDTLS